MQEFRIGNNVAKGRQRVTAVSVENALSGVVNWQQGFIMASLSCHGQYSWKIGQISETGICSYFVLFRKRSQVSGIKKPDALSHAYAMISRSAHNFGYHF